MKDEMNLEEAIEVITTSRKYTNLEYQEASLILFEDWSKYRRFCPICDFLGNKKEKCYCEIDSDIIESE